MTSAWPMTWTAPVLIGPTTIVTEPGLLTVVAGVVCGPVAVTWYLSVSDPRNPVRRVRERAGRGVEVGDRAVSRLTEQRVGERARACCVGIAALPVELHLADEF